MAHSKDASYKGLHEACGEIKFLYRMLERWVKTFPEVGMRLRTCTTQVDRLIDMELNNMDQHQIDMEYDIIIFPWTVEGVSGNCP